MGFLEYTILSTSFVLLGEGLNCAYPVHDGEYENSGMICQWRHDDFYYEPDSCKWILFPENPNDNWIEAKSRKKYWEKR